MKIKMKNEMIKFETLKRQAEHDQAYNANQEIGNLIAQLAQLQADNRSLVEQMNAMAMRMEHKSGTAKRSKS